MNHQRAAPFDQNASPCAVSACAAGQWVKPGALVATVLWLIGSVAFSIHLQDVGSYNETGSPGVVVILLMWFWLSASIVLLGAELSCEIERQTARYDHRAAQAEGWARRLCRRYRRRKRDAGL